MADRSEREHPPAAGPVAGDAPSFGRRSAGVPQEGAPPAPEPPEGASTSPEAEAVEQDLDALLSETKRERDEYLELAQRTRADFDNYRKRVASENDAATRRGKLELATDLIGVIDNLERALAAAEIDSAAAAAGDVAADGSLEQGIVLTYRELQSALQRAGIEAFDPAGEPFDPNWHEALQTRAGDAEAGTVLEVVEKGYRSDGRLIRPARVVVSE